MINNPIDFENIFVEIFGNVDKTTLSPIKENRIRLELGGESESYSERIKQALDRSTQVLDYCFKKHIWFRVILWDNNEAELFEKSNIDIENVMISSNKKLLLMKSKLPHCISITRYSQN